MGTPAVLLGEPSVAPALPDAEVVAQPITAHRTWVLDVAQGLLEGNYQPWTEGLLHASCASGHSAPHWAQPPEHATDDPVMQVWWAATNPAVECWCGVNAYKLTEPVHHRLPDYIAVDCLPVIGIVDLGGEVHETDTGYRAEWAQIMEATILTSLPIAGEYLTALEDRYDASFRAMSLGDWVTEWEATYGRDWKANQTDQSAETTTTTITLSGTVGAWSPVSTGTATGTGQTGASAVTATFVGSGFGAGYQPTYGGRRLYRYRTLDPEWITPGSFALLPDHKPLVYRTRKKAIRAGRRFITKGSISRRHAFGNWVLHSSLAVAVLSFGVPTVLLLLVVLLAVLFGEATP